MLAIAAITTEILNEYIRPNLSAMIPNAIPPVRRPEEQMAAILPIVTVDKFHSSLQPCRMYATPIIQRSNVVQAYSHLTNPHWRKILLL